MPPADKTNVVLMNVTAIAVRLKEKMGDVATGLLQVFNPETDEWLPACVSNWDREKSPQAVCSLLGYT